MERILVKNIVSSYGKRKVLNGVDMSADAGQCIGIVGENGCGKSTLLNILAGLRKADSGEIILDTGESADKCAGYVPQDGNLLEELSVLDNLSLWYNDRDELKLSLEKGFLNELGIDKMCRMKVGNLSGGMKKRVSIGCALAGNPPILILDEPAAALDLPGKADIRRYISSYKSLGGTAIIATHEESDLEICDKVYALYGGKSVQIDSALRGEGLAGAIQGVNLRDEKEK